MSEQLMDKILFAIFVWTFIGFGIGCGVGYWFGANDRSGHESCGK